MKQKYKVMLYRKRKGKIRQYFDYDKVDIVKLRQIQNHVKFMTKDGFFLKVKKV